MYSAQKWVICEKVKGSKQGETVLSVFNLSFETLEFQSKADVSTRTKIRSHQVLYFSPLMALSDCVILY